MSRKDRQVEMENGTMIGPAVVGEVVREMARQDEIHPDGYPATRDGIFLAIKTASHELEHEAINAWRAGRCKCPTPQCDHHEWSDVAEEMVQAAAVLLRSVRAIREREEQALARKREFFETRRMP